MSRNKEKAQAGLNRYYEQKIHDAGIVTADPSARPRKVQAVKTLAEAEMWRKTLVGEFSARLAAINDPSLSADEIRRLNGSLNKIANEKRAWEHHIFSLGGNDYIRYEKRVGVRVDGTTYYGRAKELPEAKQRSEAFRAPLNSEQKPATTLAYFGVYDRENWTAPIDASVEKVMEEINGALGRAVLPAPVGQKQGGNYTQEDVERWLVGRKRKELMAKLQGLE